MKSLGFLQIWNIFAILLLSDAGISTSRRNLTMVMAWTPSGSASSAITSDNNVHLQPPSHTLSRRQTLEQAAAASTASLCGILFPARVSAADAATSSSISPIATLSDGSKFPLASFGLQIYDDNTAYKLTLTALECGYRNFFASVLAGNQRGFAKAVRESGIPRSELYICGSVVSNRVSGFDAAYKETTKGWKKNMEAFAAGNIEYLDQIMLDYPGVYSALCFRVLLFIRANTFNRSCFLCCFVGPDCNSIQGQWKSFEDMYQQGLTKSLSVSNFSPPQLDCVLQNSKVAKPVVNQLPYSVAYHPGNAIAENKKRGILVQAWAPLGGSLGGRFNSSLKGTCAQIGKKYNKSFAQVSRSML
jgi:diketogulonate reductase-like aldo/keto reductase